MNHALPFLLALGVVGGAVPALGQADGDLDSAFGANGVTFVDARVGTSPRSNVATDLEIQADGMWVLAGAALEIGTLTGEDRMVAVRLLADGSLDSGFGSGGKVRLRPPAASWPYFRAAGGRAALAPAGRILLLNAADDGLVGGWILARLWPDGGLDGTFGDGGFESLLDIAVEPGDLALQGGELPLVYEHFMDEGGLPINVETAVFRLLADGGWDPAFGDGGAALVGFNAGGSQDDYAGAMTLLADGRILLGATAAVGPESSTDTDFAVARLTPEGLLDPAFGAGTGKVVFPIGTGSIDAVHALATDGSGRILVAGESGNEAALARLLPDGNLDPGFGTGGRITFHFGSASAGLVDKAFGVALQSDGRILVAGRGADSAAAGMRFGVARFTAEGQLDPSFAGDGTRLLGFAHGTGSLALARAVAVLGDGRIAVAGGAEAASGDFDFVAVRLWNGLIFADDVESGGLSSWSAVTH